MQRVFGKCCYLSGGTVESEEEKGRISGLFEERRVSVRDFRDFFHIGFVYLLFDTICICITQEACI